MTTLHYRLTSDVADLPRSSTTALASNRIETQVLPIGSLSSSDFDAWDQLEKQALDGNPFLSPSFVQAALRWLGKAGPPILIVIRKGDRWIGCGLFTHVSKSRRIPVPHLRSWSTDYSFLDGLLLDREYAELAAREFWKFMVEGKHSWHGVEFPGVPLDSPSAVILDRTAREVHASAWEGAIRTRATLIPAQGGSEALKSFVSVARARSLRKGMRELSKKGEVSFRILGIDEGADAESLWQAGQRFMNLENTGWKSTSGTSLRKVDGGTGFFEELVQRTGRLGNLFFSELLVGDEVIGSVCHLVSGQQAFAFKMGWNPRFERGCPGFQLKALIVESAPEKLSHLNLIDSCSMCGSFIEHIWPHRRSLGTRIYVTTLAAKLGLKLTRGVSWARQCLFSKAGSGAGVATFSESDLAGPDNHSS